MRRALVALAVAALAAVALVWAATEQILHPPWHQHRTPEQGLAPLDDSEFAQDVWAGFVHDPQRDVGLAYEDVSFPAADGSTLRGWLVRAEGATAGLVAVHGGGADRREFLRQLPSFHAAGYAMLLFDCREHGISDGTGRGLSAGVRESEDVSAAVRTLRAEPGIGRVAVIGTSQGGASVILAAARDRDIDAVVAENPFTRADELLPPLIERAGSPPWLARVFTKAALWRIGPAIERGPIDVVADVAPRPILFMHGTDDSMIASAQSEALYARAGEPKEIWIVEGGRHAALWNADPAEWERRVNAFLARHLAPR
jgi:alpha-beta hydrolase superfamily lysophospholipase